MKFVGDKYNVHVNVYNKNADEAVLLLEPKNGEDYIYGPLENNNNE